MHLPFTVQIEANSFQRMLTVRRTLELEAMRIATRYASDKARKQIAPRLAELMVVFDRDWTGGPPTACFMPPFRTPPGTRCSAWWSINAIAAFTTSTKRLSTRRG